MFRFNRGICFQRLKLCHFESKANQSHQSLVSTNLQEKTEKKATEKKKSDLALKCSAILMDSRCIERSQ